MTPATSQNSDCIRLFSGLIRIAVVAVLCLLTSSSVLSQGALANFMVFKYTPAGAFPAGGSTVTVCTSSATGTPCTPTVTIYSDAALTLPVANPLVACTTSPQIGCIDGMGNVTFYATPGVCTYTVTGSGLSPYGPIPINLPAAVNAANTWTQPQTFLAQIVSAVATGTAPFSVASTTQVTNLNASQVGGKSAPAGSIVGTTDTQTLANKTLSSPNVVGVLSILGGQGLDLTTTSFLDLTYLAFVNTAPTISSGFGTSPSITTNGTLAFNITVGSGGTANSGVIGFPAGAAFGWNVFCEDTTTFSTTVFRTRQTGSTQNSATIGNFNSSASAAAWGAGDVLSCMAVAR